MEKYLRTVIETFAQEAQKIEGLKAGTQLSLSIGLQMPGSWQRDQPPKITLQANFYDGTCFQTQTAASLAKLMDEVYRRCSLADLERAKLEQLEQSLIALPAPEAQNA